MEEIELKKLMASMTQEEKLAQLTQLYPLNGSAGQKARGRAVGKTSYRTKLASSGGKHFICYTGRGCFFRSRKTPFAEPASNSAAIYGWNYSWYGNHLPCPIGYGLQL